MLTVLLDTMVAVVSTVVAIAVIVMSVTMAIVVAISVVTVAITVTVAVSVSMTIMRRKMFERNLILHLTTEEDLGQRKTNGVTELIEVLIVPLCLSISDLVVDILAINNEVVFDMENEVPGVSECLGHLA